MKLSEPQRRVLRTMVTLECKLLTHQAKAYDRDDYDWTMYQGHRELGPSLDVVCMLQDHGLLRLVRRNRRGTSVYVLTPKGREIAKELRDVPR